MAVNLDTYDSAQTIIQMVTILGFVNNSAMCIYHIHRIFQFHKKTSDISSIETLSISAIAVAIVFSIVSIISSFNINLYFISHHTVVEIAFTLYFAFKTLSYFLYLERLNVVFTDTRFAFSRFTIYISRTLLLLYFFSLSTLIFTTGNYQAYKTDTLTPKTVYYSIQYPLTIYILLAISDIFIGIFISIIFTRRLMLLGTSYFNATRRPTSPTSASSTNQYRFRSQSMRSVSTKNDEVFRTDRSKSVHTTCAKTPVSYPDTQPQPLVIDIISRDPIAFMAVNKFTVLTLVSIISTVFSLILCGVFGLVFLWMIMDTMINSAAIMLVFIVHHKVYKKLCFKVQNMVMSTECISCYSCYYCCQIEPMDVRQKHSQVAITTPVVSLVTPCTIGEDTPPSKTTSPICIVITPETTIDEHISPKKDDNKFNMQHLDITMDNNHHQYRSSMLHNSCSSLFDAVALMDDVFDSPTPSEQTRPSQVDKIMDVIDYSVKNPKTCA
eukprot:29314_1